MVTQHWNILGGQDGVSSDENLTDTETEVSSQTSSPMKHLTGHNRFSRSQRTGHNESIELGDVVGFSAGHLSSLPSPPPRVDLADEESRSSLSAADIGQIRDVLITATEDFGPMGAKSLQTTDQDQGKASFFSSCAFALNLALLACYCKKKHTLDMGGFFSSKAYTQTCFVHKRDQRWRWEFLA